MKELLAKLEKSKTDAISNLNSTKQDLEILRTENFKLKETIVTNSGQLFFLKEQLATALAVPANLGTVKTVTDELNFSYETLKRNYDDLQAKYVSIVEEKNKLQK